MPSPVDFTITPETLQNVKEVRGFGGVWFCLFVLNVMLV